MKLFFHCSAFDVIEYPPINNLQVLVAFIIRFFRAFI